MIVEYLFLFQRYKNNKNRPRGARVRVENKVAPFLSRHGVEHNHKIREELSTRHINDQ